MATRRNNPWLRREPGIKVLTSSLTAGDFRMTPVDIGFSNDSPLMKAFATKPTKVALPGEKQGSPSYSGIR
jgi:hypothetical protein